jgi:hypothetical protein
VIEGGLDKAWVSGEILRDAVDAHTGSGLFENVNEQAHNSLPIWKTATARTQAMAS